MAETAVPTFDQQLKLALKHFDDPQWLGQNSPLATPYFLGNALRSPQNGRTADSQTAEQRGQVLQQEIEAAAATLWGAALRDRADVEQRLADVLQAPDSDPYAYIVLELRYLRRFFKPRRLQEIWEDFLGESRAEFYRDLDRAASRLGEVLLRRLQPTFRLEEPLLLPELIGRDDWLQRAIRALRTGQTVLLSGAGGMGKTSLGAAVAKAWGKSNVARGKSNVAEGKFDVFWYTIRPTLNDDLRSLLFALAHFLHLQGASILWQKLIADEGKIEEFNLALGMLRDDLAALGEQQLLFCFDEVDRLRPPNEDELMPNWRQLLEFLDGLRGECPLLLIGQRAVLDGDQHLTLDGLTTSQITDWLLRLDIPHTADEVDKIHQYTGGNPRLIQLCIALRPEGESLRDVIIQLSRSVALQPLFERLWQRTSAEERLWLQSLAVFRSPMPADALPSALKGRQSLLARQLIQQDGRGGLTMWPALRELIYRELSAEDREQLHLQAAMIRAAHGEYTAAAYHYRQAGRFKAAVQLWYPHRQQEIERGQASAALAVFQEISSNQLPKQEREALAIIRAELKLLIGDVQGGQKELANIQWPLAHEIAVQAKLLQGIFQSSLGYPDAAVQSYEEGMAVVARLLNSLVRFRHKSGRVHVRQRNLEAAWREARLAFVEVQNLQGMIQAEQGEYTAAIAALKQALEVAKDIHDERGMAQAHHQLAAIMAYQGKLEEMIAHTHEATTYYERTGDLVLAHMARINLSAAYIQSKRFAEAAETAQQALPFFERIKEPYGMSTTAANLAEAYYELGELELAEKYAYYVLQHEEPHTMPYALFTLGMVRRKQKRLPDAAAVLQSGAELAQQNGDRYLYAYTQRALGEVRSEQGDADEAQCLWREAFALFEVLGLDQEAQQTAVLLERVG